jgi:hypothetical protein
MTVFGISGSDLKNAGWNLTAAASVTAACAVIAWIVKAYSFDILNRAPQSNDSSLTHNKLLAHSRWKGFAVGLSAAWLINSKISNSPHALITDPSLDKMLKFALIQTVFGGILDRTLRSSNHVFTIFGAAVAAAGYWSRYSLFVFGAFGALIGADRD